DPVSSVFGWRLARRPFRPASTIALVDRRKVVAFPLPGANSLILQFDDLLRRQIHDHDQILDRPIFARVHGQKRFPPALAGAARVDAGGPAEDDDFLDILDAAFRHGFTPTRIGTDDGRSLAMIVFGQDGRLSLGYILPRNQLFFIEIDDDL